MATESEKLVNDFCETWKSRNLDRIMSFFTDDAVYHNIPMEPARGKDAIRQVINSFLRWRPRSNSKSCARHRRATSS